MFSCSVVDMSRKYLVKDNWFTEAVWHLLYSRNTNLWHLEKQYLLGGLEKLAQKKEKYCVA